MADSKPSKRRQKAGENTLPSSEPIVTSITLEKALEAFLQYQDATGHSKVTLMDYESVLKVFIKHIQSTYHHTCINEITESNIIEWLVYLRNAISKNGKPYSSRTIQTYSRDVRVFFNWLIAHKYLLISPMGNVEPPKTEKALIRVFTEDELKLLDAACKRGAKRQAFTEDERRSLEARDRAFLWLLLSTGIRLSEACGLLFSDIDWNTGMIYVRGKGSKERRIPIGKVARQHLNTYIQYWRGKFEGEKDEHVFLTVTGDAIRPTVGRAIFARLKRIAGITDKRVSPHTCRHWFAVNSIKNGMPSVALQALLGHERLEMINTYVRLAEQDNKEIYTRYSPVDGLEMHHTSKNKRAEMRDWRNARKKGNQKKTSD